VSNLRNKTYVVLTCSDAQNVFVVMNHDK